MESDKIWTKKFVFLMISLLLMTVANSDLVKYGNFMFDKKRRGILMKNDTVLILFCPKTG